MKNVVMVILALTVFFSASDLTAGEKKILNIASYHPEYAWTRDCTEGIENAVRPAYQIETHYMDTKRIPASEFQKAADSAWEKYKAFRPDLVMLGDDNALRLLGPRFVEAGVPVVHYGVNNNPRMYFDGKIPENVSGILERPLIIPWVRYLQKIIPGIKKVLVMFDASSSSNAVISLAFHNKQSVSVSGTVTELKVTDKWDEWKEAVIQAKGKYDAIIIVNHFTIKAQDGKTTDNADIIRDCSRLSSVPIFATNNFAVHSEGAVGALVIVGQNHGKEAGELAINILEGKKHAHKTQTAGTFYFNKTQLNRFDLKLPRDMEEKSVFQ